MGKFLDKLRKIWSHVPKKALVISGIITAVAVPLAVNAWGPGRPTFTDQNAADYITFNSIVSSKGYGDERDFVNIKEKSASVQSWSNTLTVEKGKTYTVRMFVHNNAKADLGLVAENVRATAAIDTAEAKTTNYITGYINSSNATPTQYWDDVKFVSETPFNLAYVPGSATYYNNVFNYVSLSDSLFGSNGVLLGYDKLDGRIPGCYEYSGYVFFDVIPQFQTTFDFDASKQVSAHGAKTWGETYEAKAGELVDFRIDYTNVSGERQDDVTLRDFLPAGLTVESVRWYNLNTGAWQDAVNDITSTGINIGSYINAGTKTRAELTVKMPSEDELECGVNTFKNIGSVYVNGYRKDDDATVTVDKECEEPKEFCEVPGKEHLPKDSPDCKEDEDEWCDVPGKEHLKPNDPNCYEDEDEFCEVPGKEHLPKDSPDCKEDEDEWCGVPGKEHLKPNDPNCKEEETEEFCEIPGKEHLPKDSPDCASKTVDEPTVIPKTGIGAISGILGLGSMTTAGAYYISSRRNK